MIYQISDSPQKLCEGDSVLARKLIEQLPLALKNHESHKSEILQFGDSHTDWLYRTCLEGHLTASALVVNSSFDKVLLIHHKKLDLWLQPGGHADGDGNLANVAIREVFEETGLENLKLVLPAFDIDVHTIPAIGNDESHLHLDLRFVLIANDDAMVKINHEVNAAVWVTQDDPKLKDGNLIDSAALAVSIAKDL